LRRAWILIGAAAIVGGGCIPEAHERAEPVRRVITHPDGLAYHEARIILSGKPLDTTWTRELKDGRITFQALSEGRMVEEEVYQVQDGNLELIKIGDMEFVPPIRLFKNPVLLNDAWRWSGQAKGMAESLPAEAKLTADEERLNKVGGPYDTIRTHVSLTLISPDGTRRDRNMTFWAVDGRGIVCRDLDQYSTREPK